MAPRGGGLLRSSSERPVPTEKPSPVGHFALERAEAPFVFSSPREVPDDASLGVVEALHLEQGVRPTYLVHRPGSPHHEAFAAERFDAPELCTQGLEALAARLRVGLDVGFADARDDAGEGLERRASNGSRRWGTSNATYRISRHASPRSWRRTVLTVR
jgi:hypothetical protein